MLVILFRSSNLSCRVNLYVLIYKPHLHKRWFNQFLSYWQLKASLCLSVYRYLCKNLKTFEKIFMKSDIGKTSSHF
jgi:hypothetical protein